MRLLAAAFALLTLYYVRFLIAVRQETSTLIQIGLLLAAAVVLTVPLPLAPAGGPGFRGGRPISIAGWACILAALALSVGWLAWADHDAHSGSDALTRAVPTLCLIVAVLLRLMVQFDSRAPDGGPARSGRHSRAV